MRARDERDAESRENLLILAARLFRERGAGRSETAAFIKRAPQCHYYDFEFA